MASSISFIQTLFARNDSAAKSSYLLKELRGSYIDRIPNEKFMLRSMLMTKYGKLADTVLRSDLRSGFHVVSFRPENSKFHLGALVWTIRYDVTLKQYVPVSMLVLIKKSNFELSDLDALQSAFTHFISTRRSLTNGRSSYTTPLVTYKLFVTDEGFTNIHLPSGCITQPELGRLFNC